MAYYADTLSAEVRVIGYDEAIEQRLRQDGVTNLHVVDPVDDYAQQELEQLFVDIVWYPSPNFMTSMDIVEEYFFDRKKYFMANFYEQQRTRFDILMKQGKPVGGKWSFDSENRKKMPKGVEVPDVIRSSNTYINGATSFVEQHFVANPGSSSDFFYPVTHKDAEKTLDDFLHNRFFLYGDYQDAIVSGETFLFHSVISPALNCGLLDPGSVINKAVSYGLKYDIGMNAIEGFVRQVIGWREFMRGVYLGAGRKQRSRNFWKHTRKIPRSFYDGTTGIDPVDDVIKRVLEHGYCHHIERLMILGNFMLLCRFDPHEVYRWFMELFVDAYDWVMVSNVYGMSQYADGGMMTTKPYLSGSNYVLKMSNFSRGDWCGVWDGLYWTFIADHKDFFGKNPRLSMMARLVERMDPDKMASHRRHAKEFLDSLQ